MKIDHVSVYRDPSPTRVSVPLRIGHSSSVTAAGTVPASNPARTTPSIHRLGVLRTLHQERKKSITEENIQTKKIGAKTGYVDATWALGPNAFDTIPSMIEDVDVTRYVQPIAGA